MVFDGDMILNISSEAFVKSHIKVLQDLAQTDRTIYTLFLAGKWDELETKICNSVGIYDR